ncbi:MAG: hypothetical protein EBS49_08545 [Verrucomicrobia bacterium]|nr:hypothetical protein [Verrucomicrobiota bacterium]NBU69638.1 hypothetical protein [Verrucomicrobiota bacterium]NCA17311.1 hypothetical protein [Betaproteobacteria bacterium]
MSKEATNLTLPKQVKYKGVELAKRAGMSLSTYVAQLILKEAARDLGVSVKSPALYEVKSRYAGRRRRPLSF